jgi:protein ImuB
VNELLLRWGVRTFGELRRLPRDGLARRLPAFVLEELDEAYGLRPAVRRRLVAPERFRERLELPAELDTVAHLEPALDRLLERMGRFLRVRDAAVAQLRITFVHREHPPTCVPLGRGVPSGAPEAWRDLLRERLARVQLPAPVLAVALRTGVARPQPAACAALPGLSAPGHDDGAAAALLLDRLRARLGERAVQGVRLVSEHRPEAAWRCVRPTPRTALPTKGGPGVSSSKRGPRARSLPASSPSAPPLPLAPLPLAPRPLWLLATPERLAVREGQPWHHGFLRVEAGPERIESGWWDGADVVRDYYVVVARSGARLWIYREPAGQGDVCWFLHGVFG